MKKALQIALLFIFFPLIVHAIGEEDDQLAKQYGANPDIVRLILKGQNVRPRFEAPLTEQSLLELGTERSQDFESFLAILEHRYGVERSVIMGIWGIETRFGQFLGHSAIGPALTKLARSQPHKRAFAQEQLRSVMRLVEKGDIDHRDLVSSYAGAIGHTQFLPTSYERYAVDGNGDGRIDLWNAKDALASTANYLQATGWKKGVPWGIPVDVPDGIYKNAQNSQAHNAQYWEELGVKAKYGSSLPEFSKAYLERFGGGDYLLSENYFTILKYNASRDYAFSVVALGDQIYFPDEPGVEEIGQIFNHGANIRSSAIASTPKGPCRSKVCGLQLKLRKAGFYKGAIDGVYGPQTKRALGQYLLSRNGRN